MKNVFDNSHPLRGSEFSPESSSDITVITTNELERVKDLVSEDLSFKLFLQFHLILVKYVTSFYVPIYLNSSGHYIGGKNTN